MDQPYAITPYPDGRWWPADHLIDPRYPLLCRGNTGEVYPGVVSILTASVVVGPFSLGMGDALATAGFATRRQLRGFDGTTMAITSCAGGYLYGNVSLARSAAVRMPGMTVEMVDRQLFGLSDAPGHRRSPGDRNVRATVRAATSLVGSLLRPSDRRLVASRVLVDGWLPTGPLEDASSEELVRRVRSSAPFLRRMMGELVLVSSFAGAARSVVERLVAPLVERGDLGPTVDDVVNRLTSGLGTIESAEPAADLWVIARAVAAEPALMEIYDRHGAQVGPYLAAGRAGSRVVDLLDAFVRAHGHRGPDEWELRSPTWATDSSILHATIDRLRFAPDERDPRAGRARLAQERTLLVPAVRARLPRPQRRPFDLALRSVAVHQSHREGTKSLTVRLLFSIRLALAELARRSPFDHDDAFLLDLDELVAALQGDDFGDVVAERRRRHDHLRARRPPFWFEGRIPDPATWPLRETSRRPDAARRVIDGIGVCSGVVTGTARVVSDPADPGDLAPSDILVAPITDPAWTPLFLAVAVAGVVVDVGAHQSHAAIVARELGIPAVVSATGASTSIPDGALVTVDGGRGTVLVHGRGDDPETPTTHA